MVPVKIAARIYVANRIVEYIAVAIVRLGIKYLRDKRIGTDEAAEIRVVVSAAVVEKPAFDVLLLPGEPQETLTSSLQAGHLAPGIVLDKLIDDSILPGDDVDPAQVIIVIKPLLAGGLLYGKSLDTDPDIFDDHTVGFDPVALKRKNRRAEIAVLLDSDAGVIVLGVDEPAACKSADPIIIVPGKSLTIPGLHVAVGIIAVSLAVGGRCHGRGVKRIGVIVRDVAFLENVADRVVDVTFIRGV